MRLSPFEQRLLARLSALETEVRALRRTQCRPARGHAGPGCSYCHEKGSILRRCRASSDEFQRVPCPRCAVRRRWI